MNTNIKPGSYLMLIWHWEDTNCYFYQQLFKYGNWDWQRVNQTFCLGFDHSLRSELVGAWRLKSWK